MATFRDLLSAAKAEITEVDTATAADRIADGAIVLDVREPDEYDQGALPDAIHLPRGHLESQVEAKLLDKTTEIVIYCAGGVRSAFAAKTMFKTPIAHGMLTAGYISQLERGTKQAKGPALAILNVIRGRTTVEEMLRVTMADDA